MMVPAQDNWWGTTNNAEIDQRIFDYNDDYNKGQVLYAPTATEPIQTAPAYVRAITLTPESPVGIEAVTFDVEFSREMDADIPPDMVFYTTQKDTWSNFTTSNSSLPHDNVTSVATDGAGNGWFGTWCGGVSVLRANGTWDTYTAANSALATDCIHAIKVNAQGDVWIIPDTALAAGVSVLRTDGSWETYTTDNSGLVYNMVSNVVEDTEGNTWFATYSGVSVLRSDNMWQSYTMSNSGLASNQVSALAVDTAGNTWFGTDAGISILRADNTWQTFDTSNSGLTSDEVSIIMLDAEENKWIGTYQGGVILLRASGHWEDVFTDNVHDISVDVEGNKWFGTDAGVKILHPDGTWHSYTSSNSGLTQSHVKAISVDDKGNAWFGANGVDVLWSGREYSIVNDRQWLSPTRYQAQYQINALIPRDAYLITVRGARGMDGIEIPPNGAYTFTVDYAGAIGDSTPPDAPHVIACGADSPDTLSAQWTADDSDGAITLYRYAIGTSPGDTDIVNWTETQEISFLRSDLNLTTSQIYYVAVQARNTGGLWSEFGISNGVIAGSGSCPGADFSVAPVEGAAPLEVKFTDTSVGTVDTWLWDFGDEMTSTLENPSHLYDVSGVYTVSLQVFGPGGGDFIVRPNLINVQNFEIYLPLTLRSYASRSSASNTIIGHENN
jgi:hypothetical protein